MRKAARAPSPEPIRWSCTVGLVLQAEPHREPVDVDLGAAPLVALVLVVDPRGLGVLDPGVELGLGHGGRCTAVLIARDAERLRERDAVSAGGLQLLGEHPKAGGEALSVLADVHAGEVVLVLHWYAPFCSCTPVEREVARAVR